MVMNTFQFISRGKLKVSKPILKGGFAIIQIVTFQSGRLM